LIGGQLWVRPLAAGLDRQAVALLALVTLTLAGGFIGSPFWWLDEENSFSWKLPPLASRMLAAAGWAFVVASLFALKRPTRNRLRLHLVLLTVYLAPLVVAALVLHTDRFDFHRPITWSFFAIAGTMTFASIYFLFRFPEMPAGGEPEAPVPATIRVWLLLLGVATGLWGAALFYTDSGFWSPIWVWPGDPLTSRLIGVMLLAIGAGSLWSIRSADTARMMLAVASVYGLGVAAASLWNQVNHKPVKELYVLAFGAIALTSLAFLAVEVAATRHANQFPANTNI
jgi:hypothetical protein